jgi:hypothetical protein
MIKKFLNRWWPWTYIAVGGVLFGWLLGVETEVRFQKQLTVLNEAQVCIDTGERSLRCEALLDEARDIIRKQIKNQ